MKSPTIAVVALIVIQASANLAAERGATVRTVAEVLALYASSGLVKSALGHRPPRIGPTSRSSCRTRSHMVTGIGLSGYSRGFWNFDGSHSRPREKRAAPSPGSGGRQKTADRPACSTSSAIRATGGEAPDVIACISASPLTRRSVVDRGSASWMVVAPQGRNHDLSGMSPAGHWNVMPSPAAARPIPVHVSRFGSSTTFIRSRRGTGRFLATSRPSPGRPHAD